MEHPVMPVHGVLGALPFASKIFTEATQSILDLLLTQPTRVIFGTLTAKAPCWTTMHSTTLQN